MKCIDVNEQVNRVKQLGKSKRHYFSLNGYWHFVELDDKLPPLLSIYIREVWE